ncbi:MAG: hypothetical protein ACK5B6_04705 [Bacteroidia bacterium]|jgi:hypothetical protein
MRIIALLSLLIAVSFNASAQRELFSDESSVVVYLEGKVFYNSENGLKVSYGYIPSANTYGIMVTNRNGVRFNFINVRIDSFGTFADLNGMSPEDGSNFGFRLYSGKLIVGRGEPGEQIFYLQ